jgi:hypothetical protein
MDLPESSPMWRVWAALAALVATCPCTRSTPPPGPWRPQDHQCLQMTNLPTP